MTQDTGKAKLPGLVSPRVDNPDLARWVQAVAERLEVREGARGNPYERAVTVRDLTEGGIAVLGGGGRLSGPGGSGGGGYGPGTNPDYDLFWENLKNSSLYRELMKRLNDPTRFDDMAEEVKAVLLRDIAEEARLRGADIQRMELKIQTETRSLAMAVQEVTAAVQDAAAGVRFTQVAQADATNALAANITQVQAKFGERVAGVEQVIKATAGVDGSEASYYVKVDVNKAYGAFGLSAVAPADPSKPAYSQFLIAADKFAVISPDGKLNPFGIDSTGIYLNGKVRINARPAEDLGNEFYLSATGQVFNQNPNTNALTPTAITVTANRKGTIAAAGSAVAFSTAPSVTYTPGTNAITIPSSAFASNSSVKVTATMTHNGATYSDEFTLYKVVDGADALVGFLTNESHALPADDKGAVSNYDGASGEFVVFKGGVKLTTGVTYIVFSKNPAGLVVDINSTGKYTVTSGLTPATGTVTFRATVAGQTIDKVFTISQQRQGVTGGYTDYIFKRSTTAPGTPTGVTPFGWSDVPPTGTTPLYMSQASKRSDGTLIGAWSAPVRLDGEPGADGKYTIYQYATGTAAAATGTWSNTPPASLAAGQYLWMRAGVVTPPATAPATWGTPYRISGEKGDEGADGARGSLTGYTQTASAAGFVGYSLSGSSWAANSYENGRRAAVIIWIMLTGQTNSFPVASPTSHLRIGDTVTLTNSTAAETRYWGGTAWMQPGVVIDGNLLVNGTISGSKINADSAFFTKVQAVDINASKIMTDTIGGNGAMKFGFGMSTAVTLNGATYKGAGYFRTVATDTFGAAVLHDGGGNAFAAGTYGTTPTGAAAIFSGGGTGGMNVHTAARLCGTDFQNGIIGAGTRQTAGAFAHVPNGNYAYLGRSDQAAWFKNSSVETSLCEGGYGVYTTGAISCSGLTVNGVAVSSGGSVDGKDIKPSTVAATGVISSAAGGFTTQLGGRGWVGIHDYYWGLHTTGSIGAQGNVVAMGDVSAGGKVLTFTGAHFALLAKSAVAAEGDIVLDNSVVSRGGISEVILSVVQSRAPNQKGALGVYSGDDDTVPFSMAAEGAAGGVDPQYAPLLETHKVITVNSLGEGQINLCGEGGDLEIGDLIVTSSMPGKGMKQADDLVRAATVAKVREPVKFASPTEVKMVACIYLCG